MDISPLDVLSTELVVLKPRYGSNDMNVQVVPKNTITKQMLANDVYIAQEFIDSSKGIPSENDNFARPPRKYRCAQEAQ